MALADPTAPRDPAHDVAPARPATVSRLVLAAPEQVWSVLADGWAYERWVVGARRIRHVDPAWPAPGARFHHEVGVGPAHLDDSTQVVESRPGERLVLGVGFRPAGTALVSIELSSPAPGRTSITITERPTGGPARRAPWARTALRLRNVLALRRLARIVETRSRLAGG